MKNAILIALSVMAVCSILAGTVIAAKEGYQFQIFNGGIVSTDGAVSPETEWDDSYKDFLYDGWTMSTNFFRCKWQGAPVEAWLIEILTDTTPDAGDNYKMCVDTALDGATAPQTDDFKIDWTGGTTTCYHGTGTAWGSSTAVVGTDVIIATSIAASPASATQHRIIEIYLDKAGAFAMGMSNNMYMEYTDASTGKTYKWPPMSNPDVPNDQGVGITEFSGEIPEGLTIGVMLAVSSVAVVISARYFKKPKL